MMGSEPVRAEALRELRAMPDWDPDARAMRRVVASLRETMRRATSVTKKEREEFMTEAWAEFERWEERTLQRGHKEGHRLGMQAAVQDLCEVLGIDLTEERQELLKRMDLPMLEALRTHLKQHRAWPG
jgi:flagellar biosynthesis/type III secretory pathway protein FliH